MLEVEATGDTIHVEQFTGKVKTGTDPAFHRGQIDLSQINTSGGDKFLSEGTTPLDGINTLVQP